MVKYINGVNALVPELNCLFCSEILMAARALLGQEVYFRQMELHNKAPRCGSLTPPHQDNFYFCLEPADALTAYIPLDLHEAENGGLSFVRGSHRLGTLRHEYSSVRAFLSFILECNYPDSDVFCLEADAGDVSFHHVNTIHYASDNPSDKPRRSISIRVYGVQSRWSPEMANRYEPFRAENRRT